MARTKDGSTRSEVRAFMFPERDWLPSGRMGPNRHRRHQRAVRKWNSWITGWIKPVREDIARHRQELFAELKGTT